MRPMPAWLAVTCRVVLTLVIPLALVLTNVRLLMTPVFLDIEYSLPGFPDDPYGFTKADRLHWSKLSLQFLLNDAGIDFVRNLHFLAGQTAPPESCQYYLDGDCTRLYNDRELRHMSDVKVVVRWTLTAWLASLALCVLAGAALYATGARSVLRAGLLGGTGLTLVILIGLVTYLLISFDTFFVQFHRVFFEGETWIFLWSDTFIRLFPVRFWQDAFTFIGGAAILEALAIGAWAWWGLK
jgi:integral membrane protein (TIGR01906 family)